MTAVQNSIRLRLDVPSQAVIGRPVPVTLLVENAGERTTDLHLLGREAAFDVVVSRSDGTVVWRRLEGEIIPAILQLKTLAPGEVLELHALWPQRTNRGRRVEAGLYSVRALLPTDDASPLETPTVQLRIVPE